MKLLFISSLFLCSCITITKNYYPKETIKTEFIYRGLPDIQPRILPSFNLPNYTHPQYTGTINIQVAK